MARVDGESEWSFLPLLADELIWCEALEGFESFGEVVGHEEGLQVFFELGMGLVVKAFDGRFLESSIHALDLPVGPGMFRFGPAMLDGVLFAGIGEGVHTEEERRSCCDLFLRQNRFRCVVDEVGAVVGEHRVNGVGNRGDQGSEEVASDAPGSALMQLGIRKLAGSINGYKEIEFALLGPDLGDIDMEVADGILLELLLCRLAALDLGQAADAMTLKTAVQGRAS